MRKFLVLVLVFFLDACLKPTVVKIQTEMIKPVLSSDLSYSDDKIDIKFELTMVRLGFKLQMKPEAVAFTLMNKTDKTMKINWDEVVFVNPQGISTGVYHTGVLMEDKNIQQVPSTIVPHTSFKDGILPKNSITYFVDILSGKKQLKYLGLFPGKDIDYYIGKTFKIYLPLYIGDKKYDYTFVFKIKNITQS